MTQIQFLRSGTALLWVLMVFSGSAARAAEGALFVERARLAAGDAAERDYFGRSVSLSGGRVLIGAPGDDEGGLDAGAAYVVRYDGSAWVEDAKLVASDAAAWDGFGSAVALAGDVALVGAVGFSYDAGSAYVFRHDGSAWVEEAKLLASDGAANDHFGSAVALDGDKALIGAHGDDEAGAWSGSAYVFRHDGSQWVEEAKLVAGDAESHAHFGISVAISESTALVGAEGEGDRGAAYVFRNDGLAWSEEAKLVPGYSDHSDSFGSAVALSGDLALVGADEAIEYGDNSGAAYVFRRDGSTWTEEARLVPSDGEEDDHFGWAVALAGSTALVGALGDDDNGFGAGAAYVFRAGRLGSWSEDAKLLASDALGGELFGLAVALSEDRALVGAWAHSNGAYRSGAAYVFVPSLFADGFESGDTSAWSDTVP